MKVLGKELTGKLRDQLIELAPATEKAMESIAESIERKGIERGQRALVRRQLTKKFGPLTDDVLARLEAATESELAEYADRLLDAQNLADVFES